jgi:aspartokinase
VCVVVSAAGDTTDDFARQHAERCGISVSDREADALMACGENITCGADGDAPARSGATRRAA